MERRPILAALALMAGTLLAAGAPSLAQDGERAPSSDPRGA